MNCCKEQLVKHGQNVNCNFIMHAISSRLLIYTYIMRYEMHTILYFIQIRTQTAINYDPLYSSSLVRDANQPLSRNNEMPIDVRSAHYFFLVSFKFLRDSKPFMHHPTLIIL